MNIIYLLIYSLVLFRSLHYYRCGLIIVTRNEDVVVTTFLFYK